MEKKWATKSIIRLGNNDFRRELIVGSGRTVFVIKNGDRVRCFGGRDQKRRGCRKAKINSLSNFMHLKRMEEWTRMRSAIWDGGRMRSSCRGSRRKEARTRGRRAAGRLGNRS
jgi:hypothetical protein